MSEQTRQRRKRRQTLSDLQVAALLRKPGFHPDPELGKFGVRVRPSGAAAYYIICRDKQTRRQKWVRVCSVGEMLIEAAREKAKPMIARVMAGLPPVEPPPIQPDSAADVIENFLKRHVEKNKLRSADEVQRILKTYVLPRWADRPFAEIKRSDIAALLDSIEDENGAWMADAVLAQLRSVSAWFASRNDDYVPPFVRGMKRVAAHERQRSRILNDDELRSVWRATDGVFGGLVKTLLLTAQRRDKCATMKWIDLSDGVWTIASEPREKTNAGMLKLPQAVLDIIAAQPRYVSNPYVFAGAGGGSTANFSADKKHLDKASGVTGWVLHDLRRTARSLMSRANISSEHAERCLGHSIKGVEGTYNRHDFFKEKGDALAKLASLIELIVNPPSGDVVIRPKFGAS